MTGAPLAAFLFLVFHLLVQLALMVRVLLRPHREPASRIAWLVVIVAMPGLGILAYLLLGEVNIGRGRAARDHVHLLFYIWLPDVNGCKVVEALRRAAERNVTCRAMADGLGSRTMIGSEHWRAMHASGVRLATALPIGNPLLRALHGRIDYRTGGWDGAHRALLSHARGLRVVDVHSASRAGHFNPLLRSRRAHASGALRQRTTGR